MDEQSTHSDDELFTDIKGDEAADTTAADTEQSDEQKQDNLNLDDEVKPDNQGKENAKEKLIEAMVRKINSGEQSLEDIPADQQWLKPLVKPRLNSKQEIDVEKLKAEMMADLEEKNSKREQDRAFKSTKEDLDDYLNKDQKRDLEERYKIFRSKGLGKLDSLTLSMDVLNIDPRSTVNDAKRQAMRLQTPARGRSSMSSDEVHSELGYGEASKNMTKEQKREYLKSLRK